MPQKPQMRSTDEREQRKAEIFAEQRHQMIGQVERRCRARTARFRTGTRMAAAASRARTTSALPDRTSDWRRHASTALPLSAKSPRGRLWMNRMMATSSMILPSTAPA